MKKEKDTVKKPFYKKWWFWLIVVIVVIGAIGSQGSDKKADTSDNSSTPATEQSTEVSSEATESTPETESVAHREGMYGVSDKDIDSIDATFSTMDVRNDTTGNWKISTIAENVNLEEYALSYYKKYFTDDSQIHGIVNFNYKTTTKISVMGDRLDVTVYEYVDKEEHDAKLLYSGMLLKEYNVYLDNGDIEEIQ